LNYSRPTRNSSFEPHKHTTAFAFCLPALTQIPAAIDWWREVDSNHRRRKPADLQSAPVGRLGIPPTKNGYCVDRGLMCQHLDERNSRFFKNFPHEPNAALVASCAASVHQLRHALGNFQQMPRLLLQATFVIIARGPLRHWRGFAIGLV
jgi:hypothetical protein